MACTGWRRSWLAAARKRVLSRVPPGLSIEPLLKIVELGLSACALRERLSKVVVGDPAVDGVKMGALASAAQQADVAERVAQLLAGAELAYGERDGFAPVGDGVADGAFEIARLAHEVGIPKGVFNVINGDPAAIGIADIARPDMGDFVDGDFIENQLEPARMLIGERLRVHPSLPPSASLAASAVSGISMQPAMRAS